jgi:hypothetical protein
VNLTLSTIIVTAKMDSVQTSKRDEDDEIGEECEVVDTH